MKILLLDIETAPHKVLAWGLFKQNIAINQIEEPGYTLCWAAKWLGESEVIFRDINDPDMLTKIYSLINEADAVIHYNGTNFDMPTLNNEFLEAKMPPPAPYKEIDLLRTARKKFRLPSNKLDYVARHIGIAGKVAHKGMTLWIGCMENNPADWKIMKRYNIQDVKLLEKVYKRFRPWIDNHPNHALYMDTDRPVCTSCGSHKVQSRGYAKTQTQKYKRYQCNSCHTWLQGTRTVLTQDERANMLKQAK